MKTTIDIPEPLYRKAKIRAVENNSTLRQIVLEALENSLSDSGETESPKSFNERRTLLPEFVKMLESGVLAKGTDSTVILSEDRDSREDALL